MYGNFKKKLDNVPYGLLPCSSLLSLSPYAAVLFLFFAQASARRRNNINQKNQRRKNAYPIMMIDAISFQTFLA
jgi:hypothetical protein